MRKLLRSLLWIAVGVVVAGSLLAWGVWIALRYEPNRYKELLAIDPAQVQRASDEMIRRVLAWRNAAAVPSKWQLCFTAEQLNGWFAVDMVQNHPELLPPGWSAPRVEIGPKQTFTLYGRVQRGIVHCVVSVQGKVWLLEKNRLAIQLHQVRAGALPIPRTPWIDRITELARQRRLALQWTSIENDPVALITLQIHHPETHRPVYIESVHLENQTVCLAGTTK